MVDAVHDPITDHFGRQLLHWIVGYSSAWYTSLSGSEFIDNFKKLESGASILEQGLAAKFDEEDLEEDRAAARERNASQRQRQWRFIRRNDPDLGFGQRNFENLMLVDMMENCEEGIPGKREKTKQRLFASS